MLEFNGRFHIVNNKVNVDPEEEVNLIDKDRKICNFLPITAKELK